MKTFIYLNPLAGSRERSDPSNFYSWEVRLKYSKRDIDLDFNKLFNPVLANCKISLELFPALISPSATCVRIRSSSILFMNETFLLLLKVTKFFITCFSSLLNASYFFFVNSPFKIFITACFWASLIFIGCDIIFWVDTYFKHNLSLFKCTISTYILGLIFVGCNNPPPPTPTSSTWTVFFFGGGDKKGVFEDADADADEDEDPDELAKLRMSVWTRLTPSIVVLIYSFLYPNRNHTFFFYLTRIIKSFFI